MRWRLTSGFAGKGVNTRVLLILVALLAGLAVPVAAGVYLAGRDQLPRSCRAGVLTATQTDGAMTWTSGSVLWFADGDRNRGRRLVDYTPVRLPPPVTPSPSGPGSPAPQASISSPAAPSPGVTGVPSASPSPLAAPPNIEAASISDDRRLVAFMVSSPPEEPGMASLRLVSPLDPPGTAAVELWKGPWPAATRDRTEVTFLTGGQILFRVPYRFDSPETSRRFVGVAENGSTPHLVESASEAPFIKGLHATWPETKSYRLPPTEPKLDSRVIAPNGVAAGILGRDLRTPLLRRTMYEVAVGRAGNSKTRVVCASGEPLAAAALSPDGLTLAVLVGGNTQLLDLGEGRSLAPFVSGRVLDWHA